MPGPYGRHLTGHLAYRSGRIRTQAEADHIHGIKGIERSILDRFDRQGLCDQPSVRDIQIKIIMQVLDKTE